jgi:hypothetical protein
LKGLLTSAAKRQSFSVSVSPMLIIQLYIYHLF